MNDAQKKRLWVIDIKIEKQTYYFRNKILCQSGQQHGFFWKSTFFEFIIRVTIFFFEA